MIARYTKYNPTYYRNYVFKIKNLFREMYPTIPLTLSDEEVFNVWRDCNEADEYVLQELARLQLITVRITRKDGVAKGDEKEKASH